MYQVKDTFGRAVLDGERTLPLSSPYGITSAVTFSADVQVYYFSTRAPMPGLQACVDKINPTEIFVIHCTPEAGVFFCQTVKHNHHARMLKLQESITVN